jgi:hypothetical protein
MAIDTDVDEINRDESIGLGCALQMFSEHEEVINMIENLRTIYVSEVSVERAYERFTYILNQYQEQPHLLDPYLDNILDKLIGIVRYGDSSIELKHASFKYLYIVMKVRGYKVVVRHLPHEVRLILCCKVVTWCQIDISSYKVQFFKHFTHSVFMCRYRISNLFFSFLKVSILLTRQLGKHGMFCCCGCLLL